MTAVAVTPSRSQTVDPNANVFLPDLADNRPMTLGNVLDAARELVAGVCYPAGDTIVRPAVLWAAATWLPGVQSLPMLASPSRDDVLVIGAAVRLARPTVAVALAGTLTPSAGRINLQPITSDLETGRVLAHDNDREYMARLFDDRRGRIDMCLNECGREVTAITPKFPAGYPEASASTVLPIVQVGEAAGSTWAMTAHRMADMVAVSLRGVSPC